LGQGGAQSIERWEAGGGQQGQRFRLIQRQSTGDFEHIDAEARGIWWEGVFVGASPLPFYNSSQTKNTAYQCGVFCL
jgi:hypothetical protein